jgi:hypothetical protein
MANRRISQFADIGALNATQFFPVEDTSLGSADAANKRVQLSSLLALVGGASLTANQLFTGQNTFGDASPNGLSSYSSRLNVVEDGGNGLAVVQSYSNTAGHGSELQLYRARGTAAAQAAVSAGDTVGTIRYTVTSGFLNYTGAELRVTATGGSPQFGQAELGVYLGDGSGSASQIARFNGRTLLIGNNALSAFGGSNLLVVGGVNNPFPPSAAMVYIANQTSGDIPLVLHGHPVNTSGSLLELRTGSGTGAAKVFARQGGTTAAAVNVVFSDAALATNATDGFPYLPTCAGTPTGTPTAYTGTVPVVVDSTNQRLYAYSGGAWRKLGDVNGVTSAGALTNGRIPYTSGGVLTDGPGLVYNGTTLTSVNGTLNSGAAPAAFETNANVGSWGAAAGLILRNTNSTNGNFTGVQFDSSGGVIAAGVGAIITDHPNHYGQLNFAVRGSSGFLANALNIFSSGQAALNKSSVGSAQLDVVSGATGRPALLAQAASGESAAAKLFTFRDGGGNEVVFGRVDGWVVGGTDKGAIGSTGVLLGSGTSVRWSSTAAWDATVDTGLARNAANILEVNKGTPGQFGALKCGMPAAGTVGLTVRAAASPTNDILRIEDSSGTQQAGFTKDGDLLLAQAGRKAQIKEGTNAAMGTATLASGSVVVSTNIVTANSRIFLTRQSSNANIGDVYVSARSAGANFTITSTNASDEGVIGWVIVEPAP